MKNVDFDSQKAVVSLVKSQRDTPGRKLSFFDQCAAFYSLYKRLASHLVAKTFGQANRNGPNWPSLQTDPRLYALTVAEIKPPSTTPRPSDRRFTANSTGHLRTPRHRDLTRNRAPAHPTLSPRSRRVTRLGEEAFADQYFTDDVFTRLQQV